MKWKMGGMGCDFIGGSERFCEVKMHLRRRQTHDVFEVVNILTKLFIL